MKRKRLLLLGGSEEMIPLIDLAKAEGFEVLVTDRNAGAPGLALADLSFVLDAVQSDRVMALAAEYQVTAVATRTELLLPTLSLTCEALKLPGPGLKAASLSVDKYLFREMMQRAGIQVPRFAAPENEQELIEALNIAGFPAIIKPVDYSGSAGVSLVNTPEQVLEAYYHAVRLSPSGSVIVEQQLQGREISVESWTQFGKTHIVAMTDKLVSGNGHFVELRHTIPADLTEEEKEAVIQEVEKMAGVMELNDSIAHTEVMLTAEGPVIIETGARPGGDSIAFRLVPLATGIDMYHVMFMLAAGIPVPPRKPLQKASAIQFVTSENVSFIDNIHHSIIKDECFVDYQMLRQDNPGRLTCSADRMACYLFATNSAEALRKRMCTFDDC
jgi:biotin carboxylase